MKEVHLILTLPQNGEEAEVNVLNTAPGPKNLLGAHVLATAQIEDALWEKLITGDELDALAQAAFELGRSFERGEYGTLVH